MADGTDSRTPRPELRLVTGAAGREEPGGDAALVRAFLAGDDDAFGELVRRHEAVVLRVLTRHAGPEDARDLAQRAFLRTFEAARRWRRDADVPFRAWVLRVAVNLARNRARDARKWLRADEDAAADVPVAAVGSQALEDEEHARALRAAVLLLPRRQRDVVTLRVDAELSFAEIGQVLGITENNAKVHFHHASKRLREVLREGGDR
ncbi:MAG TPA: sigma-70 family RNA polymerase sigma factor [Anaeromyxobacteraceae bacterium]|nr:sigma-70 family RNA polymerase sigma factor [Anaeromyxobacteraceae bacterium]